MARTSQESSTSINFRMPDSIRKNIDRLAAENNHDRTSEINGACKHWINIGDSAATDETTFQKIEQLQQTITGLEDELRSMKENFRHLETQIAATLDQIQKERELLLRIIESNEHTIKLLIKNSLDDRSE